MCRNNSMHSYLAVRETPGSNQAMRSNRTDSDECMISERLALSRVSLS
jgi:hypothetical protein